MLADLFVIKVCRINITTVAGPMDPGSPDRMQNRKLKHGLKCFCKNTCASLCNIRPKQTDAIYKGIT